MHYFTKNHALATVRFNANMDSVAHLGIFVAEERPNTPGRVGDVSPMEGTYPENIEVPVVTEGAAEVSIFLVWKGECACTMGGPTGTRDSCANEARCTLPARSCSEFRSYWGTFT